jgi:hypothetical protein
MTGSYEDMMGEETNPQDHPAHNVPQATQHYAGDVLPLPINPGPTAGPTPQSADYAWGNKSSDNVKSIGLDTTKAWLSRAGKRARGQ